MQGPMSGLLWGTVCHVTSIGLPAGQVARSENMGVVRQETLSWM